MLSDTKSGHDRIVDAIDRNFTSPSVSAADANAANVVDVIAAVATSINRLAKAVEERTRLELERRI